MPPVAACHVSPRILWESWSWRGMLTTRWYNWLIRRIEGMAVRM